MGKSGVGLVVAGTLACAVIAAPPAAGARAAGTAPQRPSQAAGEPEIDAQVNYVYATQFGFGGYSIGGLSVQVYSLPIRFLLEDVLGDWDLQVQLPIIYGHYTLSGETDGVTASVSTRSIGFEPRLRLDIPLFEGFRVSPLGAFGVAAGFDSSLDVRSGGQPVENVEVSNEPFYTYQIGLSSLYERRLGKWSLSLGNAFIYAGNAPFSRSVSSSIEGYGTFRTGFDVRHPLGFTLGKLAPDASVFFLYNLFTPALKFTRIGDDTLAVPQIFEVGATIGSETPLVLPVLGDLLDGMRIGLGYDMGSDFQAWHLVFGFPF